MASNFLYSSRDHKFIIKEWLEGEKILGLDRFKDYLSMDDVDMILDQALKGNRYPGRSFLKDILMEGNGFFGLILEPPVPS